MKTAVAFLALFSGASAFAPSASIKASSALKASDYDGMVGITTETGGKMFDPMNLSEWIPAEHARKAELANGRSAMLATVGWFFPYKVFQFPFDDVTGTDPVDAILQASPQWWAQWILICGVCEGVKYRSEMEGKSYTGEGDAVLDWSGNWGKMDDAQKEDIRLKELKNGRLAMIGFASFVSAHFLPGSVPSLPMDFQ